MLYVGPAVQFKNMNHWTTYTGDSFYTDEGLCKITCQLPFSRRENQIFFTVNP